MRVAMVGPFGLAPKGTMAVRALPLAKALTRRGHTVWLFLPPWSWPEHSGRIWEDDGVRIDNVPISPVTLIVPRIVTSIRKIKPDVIHFFKPKAYSGLSAFLFWYMKRSGLERARMVLDTDDWEGAGGWNEIENYSRLQKWFFSFQEGWGLDHNHAVTVASRALEELVWSRGRSRQSVYYLPNGYSPLGSAENDKAAGLVSSLGLGSSPTVLLYTRFVEFSVDRIAALFERLSVLVPGVRFLVVGKGLNAEEEVLRKRIAELARNIEVVFAGWVDSGRLPGYFRVSDIAVYPMDDTLVNRCKCPVKLVDLLGAGVPVIADAVGQAREYIKHGETGILVSTGSVEEMACATGELLNDRTRRERIGRAAAASISREYSWDKLAGIAEAAYGIRGSLSGS